MKFFAESSVSPLNKRKSLSMQIKKTCSEVWSELQTLLASACILSVIAFAEIQVAVTSRFDTLKLVIPKGLVFFIFQMYHCLVTSCQGKVPIKLSLLLYPIGSFHTPCHFVICSIYQTLSPHPSPNRAGE